MLSIMKVHKVFTILVIISIIKTFSCKCFRYKVFTATKIVLNLLVIHGNQKVGEHKMEIILNTRYSLS